MPRALPRWFAVGGATLETIAVHEQHATLTMPAAVYAGADARRVFFGYVAAALGRRATTICQWFNARHAGCNRLTRPGQRLLLFSPCSNIPCVRNVKPQRNTLLTLFVRPPPFMVRSNSNNN